MAHHNNTRLKKILTDPNNDADDVIANTSAYCPLAWTHLHISTNGDVLPCCISDSKMPFSNINEASFDEIWNGEQIKKFRLDMLADKKNPACTACYKKESTGNWSQRIDAIRKFNKSATPWVMNTSQDGTSIDGKPIYWDIRFSNICNMRCRMCGHFSSSKWFKDAQELKLRYNNKSYISGNSEKAILPGVEDSKLLLDRLEEFISTVEEIYFAGGEPLQMEEHYRILEMLDKHKRYDVRIRYSTNLLSLKYKNKDLIDLWKRFERVECVASIDASGKRAEVIRHDTKWDQIIENVQSIRFQAPNVWLRIAPTVQIFNIYTLPDLHKEFLEKKLINVNDVFYNILETPQHHNIQNLPAHMKDQITAIWTNYRNWLVDTFPSDFKGDVLMTLDHVIGHLNAKPGDLTKLYRFVKQADQLDELRKEHSRDVFPELDYIWKTYSEDPDKND